MEPNTRNQIYSSLIHLSTLLTGLKGKKSSAEATINIARATFELGTKIQWSLATLESPDFKHHVEEIKSIIKSLKTTIEFGTSKVAFLFSTMEPTNPVSACCITSGIMLLRDLGAPYVLKNCESFEGTLYNFIGQCPPIDHELCPNWANHRGECCFGPP